MMTREQIIKGLEICYNPPTSCEDCPYVNLPDEVSCNDTLCRDALALLKEQEAVERTSRKGTNGFSIVWTCGACGTDLHPNNAKAKYCSNCGKAVKWE